MARKEGKTWHTRGGGAAPGASRSNESLMRMMGSRLPCNNKFRSKNNAVMEMKTKWLTIKTKTLEARGRAQRHGAKALLRHLATCSACSAAKV